MPRRCAEVIHLSPPPKKKCKAIEELPEPSTPSLDVSFCDDEALPPGLVFSDIQQKKWRIGKPIGRGSFGRIYLASDIVEKEVTKLNARYVVKIEPHTNGPLFVEVHCLIRTAQVDKVKSWRVQNKQKRLGMPLYIASGSFTDENTGTKYRFLVLPRYDVDLNKIISRTKVLDLKNVLVLAIQILDVLEYLHNEGYTHSDIKSSNLMLGYDGNSIGKMEKLSTSLQKEITDTVLQHKPKTGKGKYSNYYTDEDFIVKDYKSPSNSDGEEEKRLANVKKKLRKILTDKDRALHRNHAFNLRQLSTYVNYEDLNSSVCSDQSYQKLLDDVGKKNLIKSKKEFQESKINKSIDEIYKEAVLSQSNRQIYLLDYGLASKFLDSKGKHKDFGMDARKAHDGTLEYSSRDSHIGAHSRRSDLETLGYNILDWLTGTLPWKTAQVLAEPDLVHALKKNYMSDIKLLLKTCFNTEFYPQFLEKYFQYVTSLDFTEKPDYDYCRSLFKSELLKKGIKDVCLNFAEPPMSPVNRKKLCYSKHFGRRNTPPSFLSRNIKKSFERENVCSLENDLKLELLRKTLNTSSEGMRKPCVSRNFFISDADLVARLKKSLMPQGVFGKKLSPKNLRSKQKMVQKRNVRSHRNNIGKFGNFLGSSRQFSWAEILAGNPEDIIRKDKNHIEDDESMYKYRIRKLSNASDNSDTQSPILQKDYLKDLNPTDAMKDIIATLKKKANGKHKDKDSEDEFHIAGYTPAMMKVYRMKEKREAKEKLEAKENQTERRSTRRSRKTIEPSSRVTRQKASTDSTEKQKVELDTKIKTTTKRSKRVCKSQVNIEDSKPVKKNTRESTRTRTTSIPNRRQLRSSKRNKK